MTRSRYHHPVEIDQFKVARSTRDLNGAPLAKRAGGRLHLMSWPRMQEADEKRALRRAEKSALRWLLAYARCASRPGDEHAARHESWCNEQAYWELHDLRGSFRFSHPRALAIKTALEVDAALDDEPEPSTPAWNKRWSDALQGVAFLFAPTGRDEWP